MLLYDPVKACAVQPMYWMLRLVSSVVPIPIKPGALVAVKEAVREGVLDGVNVRDAVGVEEGSLVLVAVRVEVEVLVKLGVGVLVAGP